MNSVLLSGPKKEPVTRSELRDHLHLDASHDALLASLIAAARMTIEAQSGLRLINQEWRIFFDDWPTMPVRLPVASVHRIKAVRQTGDMSRVLASTDYQLLQGARMDLSPDIGRRVSAMRPLEVDVVAGFGDKESDVPDDLRLAVKSLAAYWYDIDDWNQLPTARAIPAHVLMIVDQHRNLRMS